MNKKYEGLIAEIDRLNKEGKIPTKSFTQQWSKDDIENLYRLFGAKKKPTLWNRIRNLFIK